MGGFSIQSTLKRSTWVKVTAKDRVKAKGLEETIGKMGFVAA